jgi:hypothetical protein
MEVATPRRTYSLTGMDCLERALPHKGTIQLLFRAHCLAWLPGLTVSPSSGPDGRPGAVSLNSNQLRQRAGARHLRLASSHIVQKSERTDGSVIRRPLPVCHVRNVFYGFTGGSTPICAAEGHGQTQ